MTSKKFQLDDLNTVPSNRNSDCDWVSSNRTDLIRQYGNCVLLVFKEQVVGNGSTLDAAIKDAEAKLPPGGEIITPIIGFLSPLSSTMNLDIFWELIEKSHKDSYKQMEKQVSLLVNLLATRSVEDIIEFELIFTKLFWDAYIARLWEAAYVIGCGCSDDGFYDFRAWLIGQGKEVYQKAIIDPESLADILETRHRNEISDGRLLDVTRNAHEIKTGSKLPQMLLAPYDGGIATLIGELSGEEVLESAFPRISAILGSCDDYFDRLYPLYPPKHSDDK